MGVVSSGGRRGRARASVGLIADAPPALDALRTVVPAECAVDVAIADVPDGLNRLRAVHPDVIVVATPASTARAIEMIQQVLRVCGDSAPVMVVLAGPSEMGRVAVLDTGAAVAVSRPCSDLTLAAHVRALVRRAEWQRPDPVIAFDRTHHRARIGNVVVTLAPREFDVLLALARERGKVISQSALLYRIWGSTDSVNRKALSMAVTRLRNRFAEAHIDAEIAAVRGAGYRLDLSVPDTCPSAG